MSAVPHRIVFAFDFGTTYSSVAWASSLQVENIELIGGWPTAGHYVGLQTPTEIAYEEGDTTKFSWGYDISPTAKKFKWFKLAMETDDPDNDLPMDLTIMDLVRDYLSALFQHSMMTVSRRFGPGVLENARYEYFLTVPAIWSDAAKKRTEMAARLAGFNENLTIISEPEAAALYTIKFAHNIYSRIDVGDRIVVCDAGGGTVDLISYDIRSTEPLVVHECAPGTGDFCGSSFIDRNFLKLFERRMGEHYKKLSRGHRLDVARNFETRKVAFRNEPDKSFFINVPTVSTIEEAGVVAGNFKITCEEMRALFDPVVNQIIELVRAQVEMNSNEVKRVNSILLVGGFGESEYLYQRLSEWAAPREIKVIQPQDGSTAIVRGAVLKGIEPAAVQTVRRARRSYGTPHMTEFIQGMHSEADAYIQPTTGRKMAINQISWFVRKNDPIFDEQEIKHSFSRDFRVLEPWIDTLLVSAADYPPRTMTEEVTQLCKTTSDLTYLGKRKFKRKWRGWRPYRRAEYALVLGMKGGNLSFSVEYSGNRYGNVSVQYDN